MLLNIVTGKQPSPLVCIQDLENNTRATDTDIITVLQRSPATTTEDCTVIVDSFSPLVFNYGFMRSYCALHSLVLKLINGINVSEIICLMHEDTLPFSHAALPQLRHLATAYIEITAPTQSSNGNPIASTIYKKKSGRVLKEVEYYSVDSENRLKAEKLTSAFAGPAASDQEMKDDDDLLADLTTFKLSLGQQEKQARSELVLPYLRMNKEKGGKVFYQPDAADDWDEEDPDDDLDV
ncbi:elongator complex protein 5 isoform X3 [Periplaneta americana]|uniref:elongator complex protein 5 isoform X3 n=1 Tax=Periplaneta americana TaxID=6978 RepID=UPI0037E814FE